MSEVAALPPFVTVPWLADHLDEVVVADVRWSLDGSEGEHTYRAGHLPGAVYVDLDRDLAAPPGGGRGRHPLPDPEPFAQALGARGIGEDVPVVAYDTLAGAVAGRLVWMLRVLGQPAAVLDGGLAAWDGPLESGPVTRPPATRTARAWPADGLADDDQVARLADDGQLVDVRAPERFRGEHEPVDPRPGHIPGAVNLPVGAHLDRQGRLLPPAELQRRYDALGVGQAPAVSCGSGVNACFAALALETLGRSARVYAGSWSAWSSDPDRPAATG